MKIKHQSLHALPDSPFDYGDILDLAHPFVEQLISYPLCNNPDVQLTFMYYRAQYYHNELFAMFKLPCPNNLNKAVIKRKAEYLAGRIAAQQTLMHLQSSRLIVDSDKARCPLFPVGYSGSISHTKHIAASAITKQDILLGIDVEDLLNEKTCHEIKWQIIQVEEYNLIQQHPWSFAQCFTLVFSAKEAIFKALYPIVGDYFDFHAASLIDIDIAMRQLTLEINETLSPNVKKGQEVKVDFSIHNKVIITLVNQPNMTFSCHNTLK